MKNLKQFHLLLLFALLIIGACKKDQLITEEIIKNPVPEVVINGSVSGLIMNIAGEPLSDVQVSVGIHDVLSDENGVFTFRNIEMDEKGALIIAEKEGYFYNAKFVRPALNKMAFTRFKLIEKILTASFSTNNGATITTNGDAKVIFPSNSIQKEGGALYNGTVNVYATWIDPTGENLTSEMPGDLRGSNLLEEQVQLTSYGMIGVELEDNNGATLNIAAGQTARIELPVPSALLDAAPATIPLWHFNESTGFWEEEGEATLENGIYKGTVNHFSFWNCDVPNDYISLTGNVLQEGGVPNLMIQITNIDDGTSAFGYTNEVGEFSGFVPNLVELIIAVFDACGTIVYTDQIGPFSQDTTIDPIIVNNLFRTITISGTLLDCTFSGVSNGYMNVENGTNNSIIQLDANGQFNSQVSICSATELTITGYNINNLTQSTPQVFSVSGSNLQVGNINTCDNILEYFISKVAVDSIVHPEFEVQYSEVDDAYSIYALFFNTPDELFETGISIKDFSNVPLNTPIQPNNYLGITNNFLGVCEDAQWTCSDIEVIFESADLTNLGDVVQGSYSGTVIDDNTGSSINVSGRFRSIND